MSAGRVKLYFGLFLGFDNFENLLAGAHWMVSLRMSQFTFQLTWSHVAIKRLAQKIGF